MGLSQVALARTLGAQKTTVVRWETGKRYPSHVHRLKIEPLLSKQPD